MTRKASVAFNINFFVENYRLSRLPSVTYTVKVVVSQKWYKIDTFLLHTTSSKCHMAYRFVLLPMTLIDLEGDHWLRGF